MFDMICSKIVVNAAKQNIDHRNLSSPAASAEPMIVFDKASGKVFSRNAAIHRIQAENFTACFVEYNHGVGARSG